MTSAGIGKSAVALVVVLVLVFFWGFEDEDDDEDGNADDDQNNFFKPTRKTASVARKQNCPRMQFGVLAMARFKR
jgi:nitrogen fixation-related uncharacterized protein